MTDTPWKQEDWFTSPWNFDPEVTKDWKFSDNIRIHDVTLRDGEQQAGLAYNYDDKIKQVQYSSSSIRFPINYGRAAMSGLDANLQFGATPEVSMVRLVAEYYSISCVETPWRHCMSKNCVFFNTIIDLS